MSEITQYPPLWRRLAAIIYDTLLVTAISMAYGGLSIALGLGLFGNETALTSTIAFQLGWLILIIAFFCFFWRKAGQTLGMRAWRLKIVTAKTHQRPSIQQCIMRCFFAPVGIVFGLSSLFRKDKQCLHDLLTQSQVILVDKET
jgi:uncharacterized RDD family membrane protein YckC